MSVTHARVLAPDLLVHDLDPRRDLLALERAARWMHAWSPIVAIDPDSVRTGAELMPASDALMLDITGCGRLFGGEERLAGRLLRRLVRRGFDARVGIASTVGAAWAMAHHRHHTDVGSSDARIARLPEPADEASRRAMMRTLEDLPLAMLRLDVDTLETMDELGLTTVRDLRRLTRGHVAARLGRHVLERLDQLFGTAAPETLTPVRVPERLRAERSLAGPVTDPHIIGLCVRGCLERLCRTLGATDRGVLRLRVTLTRLLADARSHDTTRRDFLLARASHNAGRLWSLVRPRLERAHLALGLEKVEVEALSVRRVRGEQATLRVSAPAAIDAPGVQELADTLLNRLGASSLRRAELRESHVPERAASLVPWHRSADTPRREVMWHTHRPALLLDTPRRLDVLALTPDHPPTRWRFAQLGEPAPDRSATWREVRRPAIPTLSPERIASEWWRGEMTRPERTREYHAIQDESGVFLWVFREIETGRWFLHGLWT